MQNEQEVVNMYLTTDVARDGITDGLVNVTTLNKATHVLNREAYPFSMGATKEYKSRDAIEQQSKINIENAQTWFDNLHSDYIQKGYIEAPTLFDKLQSVVTRKLKIT